MTRSELFNQIEKKQSYLCIGLDSDIDKIPKHLLEHDYPLFEFNRQIIDATKDLCVAYKINTAFYEHLGAKGWENIEQTVKHIPPDIFKIADAKRADIGNTSAKYAQAFFDTLGFDAITINPYMGKDSVAPFLSYENKWVILLALTSNKGSRDFQISENSSRHLFEKVIMAGKKWGTRDNLMFVVGATHPELFKRIRELAPDNFLLVPGIGAQGGELAKISELGMNNECGLLINSSRSIIYAGSGLEFSQLAREQALTIQKEMKNYLVKNIPN